MLPRLGDPYQGGIVAEKPAEVQTGLSKLV